MTNDFNYQYTSAYDVVSSNEIYNYSSKLLRYIKKTYFTFLLIHCHESQMKKERNYNEVQILWK